MAATVIDTQMARYRTAAAATRQIQGRDTRSGHGSTVAALDRHRQAMDAAVEVILALPNGRVITGLLAEEHELAARVQQAKTAGRTRPELASRLRSLRRQFVEAAATAR